MRQLTVLPAFALALASSPLLAETYSAELRGDFTAAQRTVTSTGVVGGSTFRSIAESDDQELSLSGSWYFDGVNSASGPRSRAAFLDRASGLSLELGILDGDSHVTFDAGDPSLPDSSEPGPSIDGLFVDASLRYVLPGSNWFGSISLSRADVEAGPQGSDLETEGSAYTFGIGHYLGERTALEIFVVRSETTTTGNFIGDPDRTDNDVALAFTHIGDVGGNWQYGIDLALTSLSSGQAHTGYDLDLSLYPNRDIAFGAGARGGLGPDGADRVEYSLFGSWFPVERWQVRAGYDFIDQADAGGNGVFSFDSDEDRFSVGASLRF